MVEWQASCLLQNWMALGDENSRRFQLFDQISSFLWLWWRGHARALLAARRRLMQVFWTKLCGNWEILSFGPMQINITHIYIYTYTYIIIYIYNHTFRVCPPILKGQWLYYIHISYIYIVYISLGILQYILMFKTHILMVVVKQGTPCIDLY